MLGKQRLNTRSMCRGADGDVPYFYGNFCIVNKELIGVVKEFNGVSGLTGPSKEQNYGNGMIRTFSIFSCYA